MIKITTDNTTTYIDTTKDKELQALKQSILDFSKKNVKNYDIHKSIKIEIRHGDIEYIETID